MSKGDSNPVVGFNYYFDIHAGISRGPVDQLVQINVSDRQAWPTPPTTGDTPEPEPTSQDYPANIVFTVYPGAEPSDAWFAVFNIDSPSTFAPGETLTIENLVRVVPTSEIDPTPVTIDLSGDYTIFMRVPAYEGYTGYGAEGGEYVNTPANLQIILPTDTTIRDNWQRCATGDPLDPDAIITMSVDAGVGSGEIEGDVTTSGRIYINAPELFGGEKSEGGIQGWADVMMGEPTQVAPQALIESFGSPQPGFRRMFTLFYSGLISSLNPYPKPWKFRVRRALQGWDGDVFYPEKAIITLSRELMPGEVAATNIIKAMNPAHIVFECLTNREWGRGLPRTAIDTAAFTAAADQLFTEGFGLCLRWSRSDSIESFVQSVLDHIGATLYTDRATALLKMKLIRGGYDPETLPTFSPDSGLLEVRDSTIASTGKCINEVRVTFRDPISNKDAMVKVDNLANIQASQGAMNTISKNYPGIPTAPLGLRVAQRDLRASGLELRRFNLTFDRRAWAVTPGDVIRIYDLARNIKNLVVRVGHVEDAAGTSGKINMVAVQDVFSLPAQAFIEEQKGSWTPPNQNACVARHKVFELPYGMVVGTTAPAEFELIDDTDSFIGILADEGVPINAGFKIAVRDGAPVLPEDMPTGTGSYCGYVPPEE
jgi:hypothetical protein